MTVVNSAGIIVVVVLMDVVATMRAVIIIEIVEIIGDRSSLSSISFIKSFLSREVSAPRVLGCGADSVSVLLPRLAMLNFASDFSVIFV